MFHNMRSTHVKIQESLGFIVLLAPFCLTFDGILTVRWPQSPSGGWVRLLFNFVALPPPRAKHAAIEDSIALRGRKQTEHRAKFAATAPHWVEKSVLLIGSAMFCLEGTQS